MTWDRAIEYAWSEMERKAKEAGEPFDMAYARKWLPYRLAVQFMHSNHAGFGALPPGSIWDTKEK